MNIKDLDPKDFTVVKQGNQMPATTAYQTMVKNVQSGNLVAKPQQQDDSITSSVKGALKDPLSTFVKASARVGQAIAAPFVQNKMDTTTNIQNQQTDQLNTVLAKLKEEQDPEKKAKLSQEAHGLVDQATQNTVEGQQAVNAQNKISDNEDVKLGGTDFNVQGQQGGKAGFKQIAGDALKDASYLATPEAIGATGEATGAGAKILTGAATGAGIGAAGGAGQELENPDSTTGSVIKAGAKGAGTGAVIGSAIPAVAEGVGSAQQAISDAEQGITRSTVKDISSSAQNSLENSTVGQKPGAIERAKAEIQAGNMPPVKVRTLEDGSTVIEDGRHHLEAARQLGMDKYPTQDVSNKYGMPDKEILKSRTADATPDYSKKIATDYVKSPNSVGPDGEVIEGKNIPRVNEGEGITGKRTVNTSNYEMESAKELAKIKSYPDNGTALQKTQAVYKEISSEAENLRKGLVAEDKVAPLSKTAKDQVYKGILDNLDGDARDAVITRGKVSELAGAGLSESDASALAGKGSKTTLGQYGRRVSEEMSNYDGSREGILDLRQKLDDVYKDFRGKSAFGTEHRNALDDMHANIRDYLNQELKESTASTDTQLSLDKQSKLYRAKDVLDNKAESEATSQFERFMKSHPVIQKIGTRGLMRIAVEVTGFSLAAATINKLIKNATTSAK